MTQQVSAKLTFSVHTSIWNIETVICAKTSEVKVSCVPNQGKNSSFLRKDNQSFMVILSRINETIMLNMSYTATIENLSLHVNNDHSSWKLIAIQANVLWILLQNSQVCSIAAESWQMRGEVLFQLLAFLATLNRLGKICIWNSHYMEKEKKIYLIILS